MRTEVQTRKYQAWELQALVKTALLLVGHKTQITWKNHQAASGAGHVTPPREAAAWAQPQAGPGYTGPLSLGYSGSQKSSQSEDDI